VLKAFAIAVALPTTIAVVMLLVWHIQMIAANKTTIEHAEVSWVAVVNRDGRLVDSSSAPANLPIMACLLCVVPPVWSTPTWCNA
jgi:hypothetical protein